MKMLATELQHNILLNVLAVRIWAKFCIFLACIPTDSWH